MIYEKVKSPYFRQGFGIGTATFLPNYTGSPEDHAVVVTIEWDDEADDEEVSQRLETWAGLPCLEWFRFHLHDWEECMTGGYPIPKRRRLVGYTDDKTALELKSNSVVYQTAYGDRTPRDGR